MNLGFSVSQLHMVDSLQVQVVLQSQNSLLSLNRVLIQLLKKCRYSCAVAFFALILQIVKCQWSMVSNCNEYIEGHFLEIRLLVPGALLPVSGSVTRRI